MSVLIVIITVLVAAVFAAVVVAVFVSRLLYHHSSPHPPVPGDPAQILIAARFGSPFLFHCQVF
jgi:hypothetical protein